MIIDASVLLRAYFPDESQFRAQAIIREHVAGRVPLKAPGLLPYEIKNAVWQAERRGRITGAQAGEIVDSMIGLDIEIINQGWEDFLGLARRFDNSTYDAAYIHLAERFGESLITGDKRLFNSVQCHRQDILWIEDYSPAE